MAALELRAVSAPPLEQLTLALEPGIHVVLGGQSDGASVLIQAAAGLSRLRRGRVTIRGSDPYRSPETRRRVGALTAVEPAPIGSRVKDVVASALALRKSPANGVEVLQRFQLEKWAGRRSALLTNAERRSLAMVLALSLTEPLLLALYEPLVELAELDTDMVRQRLALAAQGGVCVLCTTASLGDALKLGGKLTVLDRGRLYSASEGALLSSALRYFFVRTPEPRKLASALSREPAVSACEWDEVRAPGQLRISGPDPDAVALAVARSSVVEGIVVRAWGLSLPQKAEPPVPP
ncbi:MAG TPA: hypothetical protein VGJ84_07340 [Polyangiaceae bacterium]